MKNLLFLLLLSPLVGCNSMNKLLGNTESSEPKPVEIITSMPQVGDAPEFNIQTPEGYTRIIHHGELVGNTVTLQSNPNTLVHVFMKDRSIGQWFMLNDEFSNAFYYSYAPYQVTYHGANLNWKEYAIYQYVK